MGRPPKALFKTVSIQIDGIDRPLKYTLAALAEIQDAFGTETLGEALGKAQGSITDLVTLLTIGLRHGWPEVTADGLMASFIPVGPANAAVRAAIYMALTGEEEPLARPLPNLTDEMDGIGNVVS